MVLTQLTNKFNSKSHNMMKHLFLSLVLTIVSSATIFAQEKVELKSVCVPENTKYQIHVESVDEFKDSLTIRLNVAKAFDTYNRYEADINYTETFANETSIIQIAPTIAFQVHVTRVVIRGEKYYLKAHTFFLMKEECWEPMTTHSAWSKMMLGINTGDSSVNGVGFEGELLIE